MTNQRDEIERLSEELQRLKDAVRYLALCKRTVDEYSFFDWLVKNEVFGEKRLRLDRVLLILGARLHGEELTKRPEVPGVAGELLYRQGPPTHDDARAILMAALDVQAESVVEELFEALHRQGIHTKLAELGARYRPPQGSD